MDCLYCNKICIKKGVRRGRQKWLCKNCGKWQQGIYINNKVTAQKIRSVIEHNKECNSISSIARLVRMSKTTVQRIIEKFGSLTSKPRLGERSEEYEVDELCTYVGQKKNLVWIMYAINKRTGQVIDLVVGRRDKENIGQVIGSLMQLTPARIYTDKLNIYPTLIPEAIHKVKKYKTNHIERKNLDLRNCLVEGVCFLPKPNTRSWI